METITATVLGVVVVLALLAVAIVVLRRRRADRLRLRFGPEYQRAVVETGGRRKAVAELHQREKRVRGFAIKPLTSGERERYVPMWTAIQTQFVDDPKAAVADAEQLLSEVMGSRGYPDGDFEQRSADLSVDHPVLVQDYRTAHDISVRDAQGEASTEELRQAMLGYRALFRELTGEPVDDNLADREPAAESVIDEPILADESTVDAPAPIDEPDAVETEASTDAAIDESEPVVEPVIEDESVRVPAEAVSR
ncbi:hypothetical protein [Terricaulis silvestris]|uniref:Secreted protein n=1 Tax=Terricaulis silvestris TaxID=2686094 RepID=A0A6I6MJU5_9CAUL|nr:hypothetical protein [Terricaulis silvestris]QGZ93346.1 hypothetical protein DSM104635_00156 [Terricaulis silvestris]